MLTAHAAARAAGRLTEHVREQERQHGGALLPEHAVQREVLWRAHDALLARVSRILHTMADLDLDIEERAPREARRRGRPLLFFLLFQTHSLLCVNARLHWPFVRP